MFALITGKLQIATTIKLVKYLTYSVCFNHVTITRCTNNQYSTIANKESLIYSQVNYQM